jgi:hypothetical protein
MEEDNSRINEEINFDDICFVYQDCRSKGYYGNAWLGRCVGKIYGPCINRAEVFAMIKLIIESNK